MTREEAEAYLTSVVLLLKTHRPYLLEEQRGKWSGPTANINAPSGLLFRGPARLLVFVSPWDTTGRDEDLWLHVSVSTPTRDPTYAELTDVRRRLFREADTVLHVWPPASEHYNLHPHCLHLWTPMDGSRPIPDLRGEGGGV